PFHLRRLFVPYTTLFRSTIRLAQLAWLYHSTANLFSQLISCDSHELLAGLFRTGVSEYWQSHYLFGKSHPPRKKLLSSSFINLRSEEHTSELQSRENLVC